jgi:rubrerythrin
MTDGEQTTGTSDENYNLISILYHMLDGAETYDLYAEDAEDADDQELASFFREVQNTNRQLAERAKELLKQRLS